MRDGHSLTQVEAVKNELLSHLVQVVSVRAHSTQELSQFSQALVVVLKYSPDAQLSVHVYVSASKSRGLLQVKHSFSSPPLQVAQLTWQAKADEM